MSDALIVQILLGVLTIVIGVATYLSASRANQQQDRAATVAVDAAAYTRAREIYEGALGTLRVDVENMRIEIVAHRESNNALRVEIGSLRESNNALRGEIAALHAQVTLLRGQS